MAYDEELAHRVRELVALEHGLDERAMFGGLAFLLDGNMAVAVSSHGGILVRVGPDGAEAALTRPHTKTMVMGGRETKGWVRVDAAGLRTKRQLEPWVRRGVTFARTLPPKG
jgi:TfoX/Sxy family transcriptional regulator of competence genes